ncbi:hypothetical protein NDU88_001934 [Pleurodeles waltl]|uniref:Uncharacterized protein n=1 Tax=Pleurodeles waltl TaxID=8319 RepID=A0AAV7UVL4_PLEWA|nr:hypothetical protein NDU88_001934 [Pleurodeles waltl]
MVVLGILKGWIRGFGNQIAENEELDYDTDSEELEEGELREWEHVDRVKEGDAQGGLVEESRDNKVFLVYFRSLLRTKQRMGIKI